MHGDYGQVRRFVRKEHISVVSYEGLTPCAQPAIINAAQNTICANIYHTSNNNFEKTDCLAKPCQPQNHYIKERVPRIPLREF